MRQKKTKRVQFNIVTCRGVLSQSVIMRIPVDADPWQYKGKAIAKAGIRNYICDGCYDNAYYVKDWKNVEN